MLTDLRRLVALDERVAEAELGVVRMSSTQDLARRTPCAEWTLGELLAHLTTQHHGFAAAARGDGRDDEVWRVRPVGGDPVAEHAASVADVTDAFARLSEEARLWLPELSSSTPFTAAQAVTFHLVDGIVHGWDVARSLGLPFELDAEVLDAGWQVAATVPDDESRLTPGAPFGPAAPAPESSTVLDRIVAALGRPPDWSPTAQGAADANR